MCQGRIKERRSALVEERFFVCPKAARTCELKTLLNNERAYIGYEDDRYLVHTDKRTGKQRISFSNVA
jgi:hypothetical protein